MQRILLFVATNLAIVISLSLVASLLGFGVRADAGGLDLGALLGLALVFGFGGSFLSLLMSRDELEAVLADELSRLANGDMVFPPP